MYEDKSKVRYDYHCDQCDSTFEYQHSMTAPAIGICPLCQTESTHRVVCVPNIIIKNCSTLGSLAEENTKRLGGKCPDMIAAKTAERRQKDRFTGKLPEGASILPQTEYTPPWRNPGEKINVKLANMTKEQTEKYVYTGKIPPGIK